MAPEKQERIRDEKGRFLPGRSGNPAGRPPRKTLTESLVEKLDEVCPKDREGRTWREVIVHATLVQAVGGRGSAIQEVWNRSDGRVKERLEHSGPADGPITVAQKRAEDYESVIRRLAGDATGFGSGKPVDTALPD